MARERAATVTKSASSVAKRGILQQTVGALHQTVRVKVKAARKAKAKGRERIKDLAAKVKARVKVRKTCDVMIVASSGMWQQTARAKVASQSTNSGTTRTSTHITRKAFLIPIP